jgi:hypothetical protein
MQLVRPGSGENPELSAETDEAAEIIHACWKILWPRIMILAYNGLR